MNVDPPEANTGIAHYLHAIAEVHGSATAIHWQGDQHISTLTYRELHDHCLRFVSLLDNRAINKGDRLCIWAPNSPPWVITFLGCLMAGVVVVPIDDGSHLRDAERIARKVRSKAILLPQCKALDLPPDAQHSIDKLYVEDVLAELAKVSPKLLSELPEVTGDDLAEIVFTSGTTSDPKGVMISNANIISTVRAMRHLMPLDPSHKFLSVLPLSHVLEQFMGLIYPLRFGGSVFYRRTRHAVEFAAALRNQGITSMVAVPLLLDSLKDKVEGVARKIRFVSILRGVATLGRRLPFPLRRALSYLIRRRVGSSLELFVCGGARLTETTEDFWNGMGVRVLQGYGMTEATLTVTCNVRGRQKPHTVGMPLPNQTVRIASDGEILVRGANVSMGYFEDKKATRATFVDGWLKTGDMGAFDADGFLRILGRKKEMILGSAGMNIYPQDVERALDALPQVRESCVVGVEADGNTRIHAAIIPEPGCSVAPAEVLEQANLSLGSHQQIGACTVWSAAEFPKTVTLKTKRAEVAATLRREL